MALTKESGEKLAQDLNGIGLAASSSTTEDGIHAYPFTIVTIRATEIRLTNSQLVTLAARMPFESTLTIKRTGDKVRLEIF